MQLFGASSNNIFAMFSNSEARSLEVTHILIVLRFDVIIFLLTIQEKVVRVTVHL